MKAHLVTLGCPKNLVDSEASIALMRRSGCDVTEDPSEAQLLLVNACSFLESSWMETVEELERLSVYRNGGSRHLVLMGCLPAHRQLDLKQELPFVDHIIPSGEHGRLPELIAGLRRGEGPAAINPSAAAAVDRFAGSADRDLLTPPHAAYVKVAEGCNRTCTFCAIPAIRGRQVTRSIAEVVGEVEALMGRGVREVTLLAQDIVSYTDSGRKLFDLVDAISETGIDWIRVFYVHPAGLSAGYIERLLSVRGVVPYLEMPVQHASTRLLAAMRRSYDRPHVERLLREARSVRPEVVIRSEVIVGFPGESDAEFEELRGFIEEFQFDSLGIFPYSPEPGTDAATMAGAVDPATIRDRAEELSTLQEAVAFGARSRFMGHTLRVLVDRTVEEDEHESCRAAGRFYGQALDVDGEVYIEGDGAAVGEFVEVEIMDAGSYDLAGRIVS